MRTFVAVSVLFAFLAGCGGGGGDGGGTLWPTTAIGVNDSDTGNLTAASVTAPDGTYVNFYTVVIPSLTLLNISLDSTDFDAYLILFDGAALAEADLNNWGAYLLAENDDRDLSTTNSYLSLQLQAGTYVIAANSFDPATGAYTLTTSTTNLTLSRQYVQFRSFEDPASDRYQAYIDIKDNGALLQPGDLLAARLYNPVGTQLTPASLTFVSQPYTVAAWDSGLSTFGSIGTDGDSAYAFDLSNYTDADLPAGTYTFEVDPAGGGTLTTTVDFPGKTDLIPVASANMFAQWNQGGSLTLSWNAPADTFDQYRVVLTDSGGNNIFFGRVLPGVTSVTLQATLIDQITALSSIPTSASVNWTMQTRNYVGNTNTARSISDAKLITWP